jgi:hypothetical protein
MRRWWCLENHKGNVGKTIRYENSDKDLPYLCEVCGRRYSRKEMEEEYTPLKTERKRLSKKNLINLTFRRRGYKCTH